MVPTSILERLDVLWGHDDHVNRGPNADQATIDGLGQPPPARDAALDHEKVQVAVWTGGAARGRSEEDHAIRSGHGHDALEHRFKSRHAVTILRLRVTGPPPSPLEGMACLGLSLTGGAALCMPAGGSLKPASHETVEERLHYVKQDGQTVFKFAVRKIEEISRRLARGVRAPTLNPIDPHGPRRCAHLTRKPPCFQLTRHSINLCIVAAFTASWLRLHRLGRSPA